MMQVNCYNNINPIIIGLGSMGKRRIRNLLELGIHNIHGYDIREDRRAESVNLYGIKEVRSENEINWSEFSHVIISTPPDVHMYYATKAISRDIHIFIEASVVDEGVEQIIRLQQNRNFILAPSSTMRFDPIVLKTKEIIDSGKLGRVISANHYFGQYLPLWHPYESIHDFYVSKKVTGAAREIVPFDFVYLTWMFGDIKEVSSFIKNSGTLGINIDDIYLIICKTNQDILLNLTIDVVSRVSYRETKIIFESGNIEMNNVNGTLNTFDASINSWQHFTRNELFQTVNQEEMYVSEMKNFLQATLGKQTYNYSMIDDHKILNVLYAAEKSFYEKTHISI